jgi:uncharacterized membrane protein YvbJ
MRNQLKKSKVHSVIILAVFTFTFFIFTTMLESKEQVIAKFENAIEAEDIEALKRLVKSMDSELKINSANVKKIRDFIIEDIDETMKQIQLNDHEFLTLKEEKKWIFFKGYSIEVQPYYIKLDLDKGVQSITFNDGQKLAFDDLNPKTVKIPMLPGYVNFVVTFHSAFTTHEKVYNKRLHPVFIDENREFLVQVIGNKVDFHSSWGEAEMIVNGQSIGVQKNWPVTFRPVIYNGSISVYIKKKFPWGTYSSDIVDVKEAKHYLGINPIDDNISKAIQEDADIFMASMQQAFNERNVDLLINATDNMKLQLYSIMNYDEDIAGQNISYSKIVSYIVPKPINISPINFEDKDLGVSFSATISIDEKYKYKGREYGQGKNYEFVYDEKNDQWLAHRWNKIYDHSHYVR